MPILDGFAATRQIRQLENDGTISGRLPIIALTADVNHENENECRSAGMDDFLGKPVSLRGIVYVSLPATYSSHHSGIRYSGRRGEASSNGVILDGDPLFVSLPYCQNLVLACLSHSCFRSSLII